MQLYWSVKRDEVELHVTLENHYFIIISLFIVIFMPKSKQIFVDVLCRRSDDPLVESNISNT